MILIANFKECMLVFLVISFIFGIISCYNKSKTRLFSYLFHASFMMVFLNLLYFVTFSLLFSDPIFMSYNINELYSSELIIYAMFIVCIITCDYLRSHYILPIIIKSQYMLPEINEDSIMTPYLSLIHLQFVLPGINKDSIMTEDFINTFRDIDIDAYFEELYEDLDNLGIADYKSITSGVLFGIKSNDQISILNFIKNTEHEDIFYLDNLLFPICASNIDESIRIEAYNKIYGNEFKEVIIRAGYF